MNPLRSVSSVLAVIGILAVSGCNSLEVAPSGNPDRTLTGTINPGAPLPAGSEIVVRLLVPSVPQVGARLPASDIPVVAGPSAQTVERVLGEFTQTLSAGTIDPVPFRISYHADDAVLRRGLNVEARVSVGGKLRYRTINAHPVTLGSSPYPHAIAVQPVER